MEIFAYCTEAAREAVGAATGVDPLTSPPMRASQFNPQWLEAHDLIYFRLHGMAGRSGWFGDGGEGFPLALTPVQVRAANLSGAVVVVANCYGDEDDAMIEALYDAGAIAVIAGPGENAAAANKVVGTDLLVQWIIRAMRIGMAVERALDLARARLIFSLWRAADRDARAFKIVSPKEGGG